VGGSAIAVMDGEIEVWSSPRRLSQLKLRLSWDGQLLAIAIMAWRWF